MIKKILCIVFLLVIPSTSQAIPIQEITCAGAGVIGGLAAQKFIDTDPLWVSIPGVVVVAAGELLVVGLLSAWNNYRYDISSKKMRASYIKHCAIALGSAAGTTGMLLGLEYGFDKKKNKKKA